MRKVVIESFGVETSDLIILAAMEADDLAAQFAKCAEIIWQCPDVCWIKGFGYGGVLDVVRRCVPIRITEYHVFEPILSIFPLARRSDTWDVPT